MFFFCFVVVVVVAFQPCNALFIIWERLIISYSSYSISVSAYREPSVTRILIARSTA